MDNLMITKESNKDVYMVVEEDKNEVRINLKENNKEVHIYIEEKNKEVHPSQDDFKRPRELAVKSLVSSLNKELVALPDDLYGGFIFKVSEKYRKLKEESYTPRVVSIGPLHHGKSHLQAMEVYKLKCLKHCLNKYGISLNELGEHVTEVEGHVRACYEDFKFNSEEFSKMILVDAIFIIQLIVKDDAHMSDQAEILGGNSWKASDIMHDMLLLENQLPLFFIAGLLRILDPVHKKDYSEDLPEYFHDTLEDLPEYSPDILEDSPDYFQESVGNLADIFQESSEHSAHCEESSKESAEATPVNYLETYERSHDYYQESFLKDLLEYFEEVGITCRLSLTPDCKYAWHLVDFLLTLHVPSNSTRKSLPNGSGRFEYNRTASKLQKAGVRFNHGKSKLFEVSFDKKAGLLTIPQLTVNDMTETFFRNLIAFEQYEHSDKFITSYIIFMDRLINTAEDVELLVKHKIIKNLLGDKQLVADLFNNIHKEVIEDDRNFYFAETCRDLDGYSKDYIHRWKSRWFRWRLILKNKYFNNPWSAISFIAAGIVIILTVVQTVCDVLGI
ncbi:UPF0481 protein At3g47200-like [Apium graveolens]|uniref:Uncharacterized protein n=1 Tax=Apium graveolens TaxID=4045 RepID=A0A6L5BB91_APIGR|nr:hypothetical protein AG4045_005138 [Apium graveolens]